MGNSANRVEALDEVSSSQRLQDKWAEVRRAQYEAEMANLNLEEAVEQVGFIYLKSSRESKQIKWTFQRKLQDAQLQHHEEKQKGYETTKKETVSAEALQAVATFFAGVPAAYVLTPMGLATTVSSQIYAAGMQATGQGLKAAAEQYRTSGQSFQEYESYLQGRAQDLTRETTEAKQRDLQGHRDGIETLEKVARAKEQSMNSMSNGG